MLRPLLCTARGSPYLLRLFGKRMTANSEPVTIVPVDNTVGLYAKVYNMISLGLSAAPLVIMLACDTMGPEEFSHFRVEKLSHDSGANAYGLKRCILTNCRTRQGNDAF